VPARAPANSASPHMDYAIGGAKKGPDQLTIPCCLSPIPYSLPLPFRLLNP
jgi:hypothetical protein